MGLSIPYKSYNGELSFDKKKKKHSINSNKKLLDYLGYLKNNNTLNKLLNIEKFEKDIKKGLHFNSNIPIGYGVGSSGALVASIYDEYSINKIYPENIKIKQISILKNILANMENFFHGKSSGTDPLICYLKIPMLINSKKNIEGVEVPEGNGKRNNTAVFLLDSGITRKAEDLIKVFFEKLKLSKFQHLFEKFIEYSNDSIKSFLKGDIHNMLHNVKELSAIVLANFTPMIPKKFEKVWKKGLEENLFFLKLCGAGGGGFFIGFTEDFEKTKEILKDYKLEIIQKL